MKDVGIAIIDVYEQDDLDSCYKSIPSEFENIIIVSNTKNKLPDCTTKKYSSFIPFATMRNWAINHFRANDLKHYFLINSNQRITDSKIFENTIKTANTFGVWAFFGPADNKLTIEDDTENIFLNFSEHINSDFIYIFNGIVSNVGFFDERYFNTKNLDVLDLILRMREKNIYPPTGYVSSIKDGLDQSKGKIQKINYKELEPIEDYSVTMSYAWFFTRHKYIPVQDDPKPVSNEELMNILEDLQKNYSKKL